MQKKSLAALATLALMCAQSARSAILQGPVLDARSYSAVRVTWITDTPSTTVIRYGLTPAYGMTMTGRSGVTMHSWYLSGLAPLTTYNYQVCSVPTGLAETCSSNRVFTTPARPATSLPEAPRQIVDTAMPQGSWGAPFTIAPDCSNLPSVLQSLKNLTGSLNYEVRIPVRTECRGQFVFPHRPAHTGWIAVRSSAGDTGLPPGQRVSPVSISQMALFRTDALPMLNFYYLRYLPPTCSPDSMISALGVPAMAVFVCRPQGGTGQAKSIIALASLNGPLVTVAAHGYSTGNVVTVAGSTGGINGVWPIKVMSPNTFVLDGAPNPILPSIFGTVARNEAWTQVPHQSGASLPVTCSVNSWFYQTGATPATYWCTTPNTWTRVRPASSSEAIQFEEGAARYRFIGLEITQNPVPNPPPSGWATKDYKQGQTNALIRVNATNAHIVFDRCDIHGLDYPARLAVGINLQGSNVAVINSRIHKVNRWVSSANDAANLESIAININGPGPGKIENNFLDAIGMTIFFPDDGGYHQRPAANYQIVRNYFSHSTKYLYGSPSNTSGKNYMNRHDVELKRGRRILIEGNIFDRNWADVNQGAFVALSPRVGFVPPAKTITSLSYGTVTVNSDQNPYMANTMVSIAQTGAAGHDGIRRIATMNGSTFTLVNPPAGVGSTGQSVAVASIVQISDIDIRNNIFRSGPNVLWITGHDDGAIYAVNTRTTKRIAFRNNLVHKIDANSAALGGWTSPLSIFSPYGRPGIVAYVARGVEDLTIQNNTMANIKGTVPTFLFSEHPQYGANAGLRVENNIFTSDNPTVTQVTGIWLGENALTKAWTALGVGSSWVFGPNVFCCNSSTTIQASRPAGNLWSTTEAGIGFRYPAVGDYALIPASPYAAGRICFSVAGDCTTNGKDAGVDFAALNAVLSFDERIP